MVGGSDEEWCDGEAYGRCRKGSNGGSDGVMHEAVRTVCMMDADVLTDSSKMTGLGIRWL